MSEKLIFCKGGGCTAKLGAGVLNRVLEQIPRGSADENLLVGYDSRDDAAVYRISDETAVVQTLDFFPPMVDDPGLFGQIAAANALSDIYAMGGEVKMALNIVCFPEEMDLNILGAILEGGNRKVIEAGGILAGGHSIADDSVKYGLSVTGIVHPGRMYFNNTGCPEDALILTKKLGTGIVCTANRIGEASASSLEEAITSMTTLNKSAAEVCRGFEIHACTDVTGFGLLGHLHEMMDGRMSCEIYSKQIPVFSEALDYAEEFYLTAAAQKNRNHLQEFVRFEQVPFAMEEVLFDPQTSGGLLIAVNRGLAGDLVRQLRAAGCPAAVIGSVTEKKETEITVF